MSYVQKETTLAVHIQVDNVHTTGQAVVTVILATHYPQVTLIILT